MKLDDLAGRRVGILGYGQEGVAALALIRHRFPGQSLTVLNEHPVVVPNDVRLIEGNFSKAPLTDFDVLIKSPGISLYRESLCKAAAAGVVLTSGSQLWFAEPKESKVIAVTGSKGKSTTSSLIQFLLAAAGHDAVLAGNIGVPLLQLFEPIGRPEFYVVELSSYQTADFQGRPDVAILTNLFPEHLDWHGDLPTYFADKLKLFARSPSVSLINAADYESVAQTRTLSRRLFNSLDGWHLSADQIMHGNNEIADLPSWSLPGKHNLSNLVCALAAVNAVEVDPYPGLARLDEFAGLPHRLQTIGSIGDVEAIDDSISTAPNATIAALEAFAERPVTVIVGGYDRGVDWQSFIDYLDRSSVNLVITRGDNGRQIANQIRERLPEQSVCELSALHDAVNIGFEMTPAGGVVLLSPGAPSYGEFENFTERGSAFAQAVQRRMQGLS